LPLTSLADAAAVLLDAKVWRRRIQYDRSKHMATTSLTLGSHWETFVKREIASGRYASASEVVRAALRELEERGQRIQALRDHLDEGARQAKRGEFVDFSVGDVVERAKKRAQKSDVF
jgi:antitoxin ParD1/3/4